MSLGFEEDLIWLVIYFLLSFGFTVLFYRFENKKRAYSRRSFFMLIFLRFVGFFLLLFLLLNPFVNTFEKHEQVPKLIVLVDNSESIALGGWSKDALLKELSKFEMIDNGLQVQLQAFDNGLVPIDSLSLQGVRTNYRKTLEELENKYSGRLIEGVVLLSDGIINDGDKKLFNSTLGSGFKTVGLGGVEARKDVRVKKVFHNKKVILGSRFPLSIQVQMDDLIRKESELKVYFQGKEVCSKRLEASKRRDVFKVDCKVEADSVGMHELKVVCSAAGGEQMLKNNIKSSYVEVVEKRQSIFFVFNAPHPDVAALMTCFESDKNFQTKSLTFEDFILNSTKKSPRIDPDLIVLFGYPDDRKVVLQLEERLKLYNGAYWYCSNQQVDQKMIASLPFGTKKQNGRFNQVQPHVDPKFSLFELTEEEKGLFSNVPPLTAPYGEYVYSTSFRPVLNQNIQGVNTDFPLLMLSQGLKHKTAWLSGEGVWKWKKQEVKNSVDGATPVFNGFVKKIGAYLLSGAKDNQVQMIYNKVYAKGERVSVRIEVFNGAGQLTTQPNLNFYLRNETGNKTKQECLVSEGYYEKDFGVLPAGKYGLELDYKFNGKKVNVKGGFVVEGVSVEQQNLMADFDYLKRMAKHFGGDFFYMSDLDELIKEINEKKYQKQSYFESFEEYLKDKLWLLYMLVAVFVTEWLIRKWNGAI